MSQLILHILSRISSRIFVGPIICRNPEWLDTSMEYTHNVMTTVIALRLFPAFLHPVVVRFLPSYWRLHHNLATTHRLIGTELRQRNEKQKNGCEKQNDDFLQWMMDDAVGIEGHPDKLAQRQLIMTLFAMHTTAMAATHAMYDLVALPEYVEPLRAELQTVLNDGDGDGDGNGNDKGRWNKTTLNKLWKLDSFIKESQRLSPPSQLAFNRIVRQTPLELRDGTILPVGTHFAMASHAILLDADNMPAGGGGGDPNVFDGFRYSTLREDPENTNKHQWVSTDSNNLHLGYGKYACPGRFFASSEIKLILAHLLLRYDFQYPQGTSRPKTLTVDELVAPDPSARVLMRIRKDAKVV